MKEKIMKCMTTENASIYLIYTGIGILLITALSFLIIYGGWYQFDSERLDHFGSFISGVVGSLWSLASFILLYVSLQQQKADVKLTNEALTLQIKEFKQQKIELEGTKIALEEQNKTQQLQQFETTFFNLLNHYENIISSFHYEHIDLQDMSSTTYRGKEALKRMKSIMFRNETRHVYKIKATIIANRYYLWGNFTSYFEYIQSLFDFILNSNVENKQFYIRIFASMLIFQEKELILVNSVFSDEFRKTIHKISLINGEFTQLQLYNEIFGIF